ncbi:MAG: hypothetical protein ACUVUF_07845 [Candidatus Bathycorpusculaceae bacterium]
MRVEHCSLYNWKYSLKHKFDGFIPIFVGEYRTKLEKNIDLWDEILYIPHDPRRTMYHFYRSIMDNIVYIFRVLKDIVEIGQDVVFLCTHMWDCTRKLFADMTNAMIESSKDSETTSLLSNLYNLGSKLRFMQNFYSKDINEKRFVIFNENYAIGFDYKGVIRNSMRCVKDSIGELRVMNLEETKKLLTEHIVDAMFSV